ncbi:Calcium-transporting ATPase 2, endoplasmic reticulum-type [Capsicum baccatum]|uniref:Calcium-transporting ATPase 2, endoplasmic reticulum-type n=1 Tax=Capsicum baccatum TaxID=33114 RepID=A0A2G2VR66_CAPBA|nr:Calcium-transporting ATPase 2, endoplasmic reticulum-type [Capsicum baccatum]
MCTEIGKIQRQIHDESMEESDTPLKKKLDEFGNRLTSAIGIVCLVVWAINYKYFLSWDVEDGWPSYFRYSFEKCTYYFKIAVLLLLLLAYLLVQGKWHKRTQIVRKLPSMETLGSTTMICSDKTGTSTTNQMSVSEFFTLGGKTTACRVFGVEGTTYDPKDGLIMDWNCYNMDATLILILKYVQSAMMLGSSVMVVTRVFKATGLPTEAALKGAVESLLECSTHVQLADRSTAPIDESCRQLLLSRLLEMSLKGLRCLGLAYKDDLGFVGVVGLRDPPREEVHKAVNDCRRAGIKIMVITGDNKSTAEAVCREFSCFLMETDEVVAMTGDGVNDAPALKLVVIGIAMGNTGTKVAKEAYDMVDNFSTIVSAVAEGRAIYNNMKAFIRYMISSNVGEVISIVLTAVLGIPECLILVQLLWVNLVTDGPPATALGFNPVDVDIMQKPPRKSNDALINSWVFFRYMVIGSYVGIATVGIFIVWYT